MAPPKKNQQGNEDQSDEHDDDEPDEDDELLDSDDDAEEDDDDGDEDDEESADALADRVVERLGDRLGSIVDRAVENRVKSALQGVRRDVRKLQKGDTDSRRKGHDEDEDARPVADVRAARTAAREYLSDSDVKFISADERALAMDLVQGRIAIAAADGSDFDEDEVGRRVAREVAETVTKLRKHYVDRTKAKLKRDGALVDQPGQRAKGGAGSTDASAWAKGAEKAKRFGAQTEATT